MTALTEALTRRADPGAPFLTYYDDARGERVELSAVTTANWVSKTANFLDDLGVERGERVRVALPTHWETFVWLLATWTVGAVVVDDGPAAVHAVGPDLGKDLELVGGQRVALSLRPLGLRFAEPPAGFVDYNAEVLGHGDVFVALDPPTAADAAVELRGTSRTHDDLVSSPLAARVLVEPADLARDVDLLAGTLVGGGSLVVVSGADADRLARIAADERAEHQDG